LDDGIGVIDAWAGTAAPADVGDEDGLAAGVIVAKPVACELWSDEGLVEHAAHKPIATTIQL
jgi:hypothetical protein